MELTIFKSIIYGDLKPWASDAVNEKFYRQNLSPKFMKPTQTINEYYKALKAMHKGKSNLFKEDQNMSDDELTVDYVLDRCVLWGTPDKVADDVLALREFVGDFGTLMYAGKDWLDPELGKKSMRLLAEKTMPIVNASIR